jgi:hypothetical protein
MLPTYTFTELKNYIRSSDEPNEIASLAFVVNEEISIFLWYEQRALLRMLLIKTAKLVQHEQNKIDWLEKIQALRNKNKG